MVKFPFRLKCHSDVKEIDIPSLNANVKKRIKKAIEVCLTEEPQKYGKPLRRTLKGYWKLRIGDYPVVFEIHKNEVLILAIIHRKKVYNEVDIFIYFTNIFILRRI